MSTIEQPPIVTSDGNIILNVQEGKQFTLSFQDENQNPRDMTGASVELRIQGKPAIPMVAGPSTDSMTVTITPEHLTGLVGKIVPFVWVDLTGEVPDVFWAGNLMVKGWV